MVPATRVVMEKSVLTFVTLICSFPGMKYSNLKLGNMIGSVCLLTTFQKQLANFTLAGLILSRKYLSQEGLWSMNDFYLNIF